MEAFADPAAAAVAVVLPKSAEVVFVHGNEVRVEEDMLTVCREGSQVGAFFDVLGWWFAYDAGDDPPA